MYYIRLFYSFSFIVSFFATLNNSSERSEESEYMDVDVCRSFALLRMTQRGFYLNESVSNLISIMGLMRSYRML